MEPLEAAVLLQQPLWYFVAELEDGCRVGVVVMLHVASVLLAAERCCCPLGFCCVNSQSALNSATTTILVSMMR